MTLEVTFNDHHLEHWGSRMRALEGQGNVGPGGGGTEPHRAVQTVRKGRGRQALGSTVVQPQLRCSVLGRCVLHSFLAWLSR